MSSALQIFARFILIPLLGWGAAKGGLVPGRARPKIGFVLIQICYPVMIFANIWQMDLRALWSQSAFTVVFCLGMTFFLMLCGLAFFRPGRVEDPAMWNFMMGITNVTYIGIPILNMFFDSRAVALGIVYGSVGDLLIWLLYYPMVIAGGKKSLGRLLLNPCLISLVLSLALTFWAGPAPEALGPYLNSVTTVVAVVALFYVGLVFSEARLKEIIEAGFAWRLSAVKVILIPGLCFLALWPFLGAEQAAILSILAGSPVPLLSLVWSKGRPAVQRDAVNMVVISTLLFLAVFVPLCMIF